MNKFFANRVTKIEPFHVMAILHRANQLEAAGRDIIHMEIGEPDFPTPPSVVAAATQHLQTKDVKYTTAAGLPELREQIAAFYQKRYQVAVNPERIFITPGASGAFLLAFGVTVNPGDEIMMADPCYPCNNNFLQLFEANAKAIPVNSSSNYQLTAQLVNQHWTNAMKGVLIASPSNPTGTLIDADELQRIIHATENLSGCFYSDEIYHGLTYGTDAQTALKFSEKAFVINSFSKYFGMTGWRLGWLIVPEIFIDSTERLAQNIFISAPTLSQYAALATFDDANLTELESRRAEFALRRDYLYNALIDIGFDIPTKPDGAFYIYVNCAKFTDDSYQFALDLLESEGVAVTPGKDFGRHLAHQHLRFAYTTSIERMVEAINRIKNFIYRNYLCRLTS